MHIQQQTSHLLHLKISFSSISYTSILLQMKLPLCHLEALFDTICSLISHCLHCRLDADSKIISQTCSWATPQALTFTWYLGVQGHPSELRQRSSQGGVLKNDLCSRLYLICWADWMSRQDMHMRWGIMFRSCVTHGRRTLCINSKSLAREGAPSIASGLLGILALFARHPRSPMMALVQSCRAPVPIPEPKKASPINYNRDISNFPNFKSGKPSTREFHPDIRSTP